MNTSTHYYSNRNKDVLDHERRKMALYAQTHSLRGTARAFSVARNTVRTWVRRYDKNPRAKLYDRRPSTTNHPYRMDDEWEKWFVALVTKRQQRGMRVIVAHLQRRYRIPYSVPTLIKCLKRHDLSPGRHTKKQKKRDMRHVTAFLDFCERIQIDIK